LPYGFVDASVAIPNLLLDIRYYSNHNFMGRRVEGYNAPMCVLTEAAAQALALVAQDAAALG
jgi:D-alanyl-D-alanine dipeptidase